MAPPSVSGRLLALALCAGAAAGLLNVSNVFSNYAVLQRDAPVTLWGWADAPNVAVSATWPPDGMLYSGSSDESLVWRVTFPPTPASTTPFNLTFTSATGSASLSSLLLGDVFFVFGQSNVGAVQVSAMANASAIVSAAASLEYLRIFAVSGNLNSSVPLAEWPTSGLTPWQPPITSSGNGTLLGFSAVGFIMGSTLYTDYLGGAVPIGIIHSSHGGSSIQAWQRAAAVRECGDPSNSWPSSVLYNSNVNPMTVGPLALKGAYYYQGEQDVGIGATESYWRAMWYGCSLQAMIRDFRVFMNDANLFFVVQQLHAWLHTNDIGLAVFRRAQLKALNLARVAISTAFDGGDPASAMAGSPGGTVHSHMKFIPGRRTAAAFAGALYGLNVPWRNPEIADATALGVSNTSHTSLTVTVSFKPGSITTAGLVLRGYDSMSNSSHCPTERAVNASYCDWFSIQSNDGAFTWHNASAALSPDSQRIVLTAVVPQPGLAAVATRNGWSDWPVVTVYSAEGFPVMPWLSPINP